MSCSGTGEGGPRVLPIVMIGEKAYFVDVRLRQLRSVRDPGDYIDFVPEKVWPWVVMMQRVGADD